MHVVLWSEAVAHAASAAPRSWTGTASSATSSPTLIEDAIAEGAVDPDCRCREAAISIVGSLRGIAMQLLLDPDQTDLPAQAP